MRRDDDYEDRLAAQGGMCAICQRPQLGARRLAADHCHASGVQRGLLCERCNIGLGNFGDDPSALRRAAEYVEKHRAVVERPRQPAPDALRAALLLATDIQAARTKRDRVRHRPPMNDCIVAMLGAKPSGR